MKILYISASVIFVLACVAVAIVAAVGVFGRSGENINTTEFSDLLFDEDRMDEDFEDDNTNLPPIPQVNRTTKEITFDDVQNVAFGVTSQNLQFFRNSAYDCGLTGKYTFMVGNPVNGNAEDEAPLWVYLHGGGMGYWNEDGDYIAVKTQTEDTWNHEETFEDLINTVSVRVLDKDGAIEDNTLTRRAREGYRMLVVSMCDHDTYLGTGTKYPNNPINPNAEVNGLQATMAAIDYTVANYPTTHVFVHGTSAGSIGAYGVGMSYASEGIVLTGVISDYIPASRLEIITETLAGEPGHPMDAGYNTSAVNEKLGPWGDHENRLFPEDRFGAGFNATLNLQIGGLLDPFCGGGTPIPEAVADGFENNCEWMAKPLEIIASRPGNSLQLVNMEGEGHVPTNDPGPANDIVDAFINDALATKPKFPFRG